jgi:flagellar hook-associated protein 1 FlgK
MMQSLGIGVSGISAAQRGIEVVSHNIANINTPGYSRQRIDQSAAPPSTGIRPVGPGAYGVGVEVIGVRQLRDTLLDNGMRAALGTQGESEEISRAMSGIQNIAGTLEDGLATDLAKLWTAFTDVAANPQAITARSAVLDAGERLTATIRSAANRIDELASSSAERLRGSAQEVNNLAKQVASLNAQVLDVVSGGGTPNDFIDHRNVAIEQLSKLTGAEVRANGPVVDVIVSGTLLVAGVKAEHLSVDGSPPTVNIDGSPVTPGGSMGALAGLATTGLDDLRQRLDMITGGLRDAVNAVHGAGTDLDGNTGVDFFTGTDARNFAVNGDLIPRGIAASSSGEPGDGNNAIALADVRYEKIVGTLGDPDTPTLTGNDAIADLVADLGRRSLTAQRKLDATTALVSSVEGQRQETSGVSIDEEMTNLLKYQRAYEAAARVITAADEMLDTLINRVGIVGR